MSRSFKNIAEVIRRTRAEAGLSQVELSARVGYDRNGQFVSNIERGICSVPERKIKDFAEELEINPNEIRRAMVFDYAASIGLKVDTLI